MRTLRLNLAFFLAVAAALSAGCNRNKEVLEFDSSFSWNIMKVPPWYPGEKTVLTPTEQEILAKKGPPDYFRFWWNEDGEFVTSSDLHRQHREMLETQGTVKQTWLYSREKKELEFRPTGEIFEHPMSEKLQLICRYGDPSEKSPPRTDDRGKIRETWIWVDHGLKIEFVDHLELKRDFFQGTGRGTYINK